MEVLYDGKLLQIEAALEVIVSLGAIQTPKLLMQSGIGDRDELAKFGIPVVEHLPGVGRHLHDHVALGIVWDATEKPVPRTPRSQAVCFWKTNSALDAPNFYLYARGGASITPENQTRFRSSASSWSLSLGMRPASRGAIRLTGPNASDPLDIQANYLADPRDLENLMIGIAQAREIGNAAALRSYAKAEVAPGKLDRVRAGAIHTQWPCHVLASVRDRKNGARHMSVVDATLKVHGVEGLRVADALGPAESDDREHHGALRRHRRTRRRLAARRARRFDDDANGE